MDIYTFYDTKYFCVAEHGTHSDHRLRLTYYNYLDLIDLIKQGTIATYLPGEKNQEAAEVPPISEFITEGEWTYDCPIKQANNHSMVTWFKIKHEGEISFHEWDLREHKEGRLRRVKIKNTTG
jgi:hypothetical protein